jgi:hypothetical protein
MQDALLKLESLPNELLIEFFRYIDTNDLFRIFSSLNGRFSHLIQSLDYLSYISGITDVPVRWIRRLVIVHPFDVPLKEFVHVRRLYLHYVTDQLIDQLTPEILPHLEHLSIDRRVNPSYMSEFRRRVFSNFYPRLQSSYLSRINGPGLGEAWTHAPALRVLRVNELDATMYVSILSACPNLFELKWRFSNRSTLPSSSIVHHRLQRMMINMIHDHCPWDDRVLEPYLLCVPQLEQLHLHRSLDRQIEHLHAYDWLSSIVARCLTVLHRFHFYLNLSRSLRSIEQLKRDFESKHSNGSAFLMICN